MSTLLQVYEAAAAHASVEPPPNSEDTDSPTGLACNTFFYPLYKAFLDLGDWKWAVQRQVVGPKTLYDQDSLNYHGSDGYIVLDTRGLPDFTYRYQLPADHYGFGSPGFAPTESDIEPVRPLGVVKSDASGIGDLEAETASGSQTQWDQEGPYLLTNFSSTERPDPSDPDRGSWLPTITVRFVASVQIEYAGGPFVEAIEAFLGAKLAMKFRRPAELVQQLLSYGQAQLALAFETIPRHVDYRAITFTNVEDVPASTQAGR